MWRVGTPDVIRLSKWQAAITGTSIRSLPKRAPGSQPSAFLSGIGIPADFTRHTLVVPFNDTDAVRRVIEANPDQIACLILEPIAGNMGVIPPHDGYLQELREITAEHGILLIFDEVITGFRVAYGGAQSLYGVTPDMTCLGKIIGGGMPVGAYGGKKEIMESVAPIGDVYQAGTLSGNPLAVSAGIAMLSALSEPDVYDQLETRAAALAEGTPSCHQTPRN